MTWLEDDSIPSDQRSKSVVQSKSAKWPQKRVELLRWFQSDAKPLADAYEGAVHLLSQPGFPGRVHFIAHAVRDIADRLVFVLDPQLKGSRVQYESEMDKIVKDWPKLEVFNDTCALDQPDTVQINYVVASRINLLVKVFRHLTIPFTAFGIRGTSAAESTRSPAVHFRPRLTTDWLSPGC